MIRIIVTFCLIILTANVSATAQYPDILIYKGKNLSIFSNPLESYFNDKNQRPEKKIFSKSLCSAIWRGYVATWKIENNNLYLLSLVEGTCGDNPPKIPIEKIFKEKKSPIKASWFSGIIRIPFGKELQYIHMGYSSVYEKELYINIKDGKILKIELKEISEITENELEKLDSWKKLE